MLLGSDLRVIISQRNVLPSFDWQVFPHKKNDFPRPAVILSDRAQVFLQASLRVFNNETYDQFLIRAYRIVTNKGTTDDLSKTNIHACLAHFMMVSHKIKIHVVCGTL